jgi:hypothetical protein
MKNSRPLLLSRPVLALCLTLAFSLAAGTATLSIFSIRKLAAASERLALAQGTLRTDDLRNLENKVTLRLSQPELQPGADLATLAELLGFLEASRAREQASLASLNGVIDKKSLRLQIISFAMLGVATIMAAAGFVLFIRRVNELEAIITVCAWTKRVKYNGAWISFEEYLHHRFKLRFTHGISEEAAKKLMLDGLELHPEPRATPSRSGVERDPRARSAG